MPEEEREEQLEEEEEPKQEQVTEGKVVLTTKDYGELMSKLAKLEARMEERTQQPEEQEEEQEEPISADKFKSLTPEKFYEIILSDVEKKVSKPVMLALATIQARIEINEAAAKYPDFWDHEADVKKIASANPTMSISDAYLLAKSKKPPSSKEKEPKTEPKTEPKPPLGEKPGLNKDALKGQPKTVREAAKMALDSLSLETKEEGK